MTAMQHFPDTAPSPLPHLLQALHALYPPQCVVHVGIGQGLGELATWRQWADLPQALLIDADPARLAWARQAQPASWRLLHATVAATPGPHSYYRASNPQEDGLVPPDQLKPWWPQLSTLGSDTRPTQTLDQLLPMASPEGQGTQAESPTNPPGHWLLLDCLPAAQLLQGATQLLAHTSVVCARTSQATTDSPLASTGHQALMDLLTPQGFVLLAHTDTHHPALGYSLLARQPAALVAQAQTQIQAQAAAQASNPASTPASEAPANDREALAAQLVELATGNKASTTSLNPNALQAENQALHQRLTLLQEELLRAEGQIDLIKDLMLRDQEL